MAQAACAPRELGRVAERLSATPIRRRRRRPQACAPAELRLAPRRDPMVPRMARRVAALRARCRHKSRPPPAPPSARGTAGRARHPRRSPHRIAAIAASRLTRHPCARDNRLHMLARRDVHLGQPLVRQIAAAGRVVLARCRARYWRAGRRCRGRTRGRASPRRREQPPSPPPSSADGARDMVAIAEQVVLAARPPLLRVQREPRDMVVDHRTRDRDLRRTRRSASNAGSPTDSPASARRSASRMRREPRRWIADRGQPPAMILPVGEIVARAGTRHRAATPARASAGRTAGSPAQSFSIPALCSRPPSRRERRGPGGQSSSRVMRENGLVRLIGRHLASSASSDRRRSDAAVLRPDEADLRHHAR